MIDEGMLSAIDVELREQGVTIPARPIAALAQLSVRLNRRIDLDDDVCQQVELWYRSRYGNRLKTGAVLGRAPFYAGDDIFVLKLSPKLERGTSGLRHSIVWEIDGGDQLWNSMSDSQRKAALEVLERAYGCYSELSDLVAERSLPIEATADLDVAIDELVRPDGPRLGLSKWASQQVAEKCLKSFLSWKGSAVKRTHDLNLLNEACVRLGLPDMSKRRFEDKSVIEHVSCAPGARYGEGPPITIPDAVNAVHAAMMIAFVVALPMRLANGGRRWLDLVPDEAALFILMRLAFSAGVRSVVRD